MSNQRFAQYSNDAVRKAMLLARVNARSQRDHLLQCAIAAIDRHEKQINYGITPELNDVEIKAVAQYAQLLRDVPQQSGFPHEIRWPLTPAALRKFVVG